MDESIVKHLEHKQITKLSQAIRKGAAKLRDDRTSYLTGNGCGCAIAMAGVGYGLKDEFCGWRKLFAFVEEKSGHDYTILQKVEALHCSCGMTGLQIADQLEAEGL
jgi:hypothetical protein